MQIKYKNGETQHVQNETGRALVAAGLAEEIPPKVESKKPNAVWAAKPGNYAGDFQFEPYIAAGCTTCGNMVRMHGQTCYKTQGFAHSGPCVAKSGRNIEFAPQDVVDEFIRLRTEYFKRSRRRTGAPGESGLSDDAYQARERARLIDEGFKSPEVLAAELRQQMARQK